MQESSETCLDQHHDLVGVPFVRWSLAHGSGSSKGKDTGLNTPSTIIMQTGSIVRVDGQRRRQSVRSLKCDGIIAGVTFMMTADLFMLATCQHGQELFVGLFHEMAHRAIHGESMAPDQPHRIR